MIVDVPKAFWDDHRSRGCSETAVELKRLARTVRVDLDPESFADLRSDADYYSTAVTHMGPEYIGLQASARATLKRLDNAATATEGTRPV